MVEQEAESVARELAAEPSVSLIALADARKEMDDIAMKAQVRTPESRRPTTSLALKDVLPQFLRAISNLFIQRLVWPLISTWQFLRAILVQIHEIVSIPKATKCCTNRVTLCVLSKHTVVFFSGYAVHAERLLLPRHAQATLGVLYTESPPTHNANVATDEPIVLGMVEKLADGKVIEKIQEVLPSPVQPTSTRLDISHNDVNVAVSAEAALASSEATLAPPTVPAMPADHLQRNAGGVSNRTELPEVRVRTTGWMSPFAHSVQLLGAASVEDGAKLFPVAPCPKRCQRHAPLETWYISFTPPRPMC